ncbi:hypothetical protein BS47DRAFT_1341300 [Hydnum rufescens UP504]|uniref:Uncharacterized protein n=1 Tax=Hydnum rufescens UP504 TaxID=1448309 RepID=A0A9P6B1X7_9AGAM|nr:hypothetical protein BS47DRAFT_1341300 [Hydnum rufescens UP504]
MIEKIKSDSFASNYEEERPPVAYTTPWLYQLKIITPRTFRSLRSTDHRIVWIGMDLACNHIAQVDPMFIMGRRTFIREASSKTYWQPIPAIARLAAEMPYSVLCGIVYYFL